jgi:hypothetical protein
VSLKWSNDEPNVIRSTDDLPEPSTLGQKLGVGLLLAVLLLGCAYGAAHAQEPSPWIAAVIQDRAQARGVSVWALTAILRCESGFDPAAVGDRGRSHGIAQLYDHPRDGLLGHFKSLGYRSAYSVWESVDYLARILSGEFRWANVAPSRWTCARLWGIW